ncbi:MAG: TRAP transporter small permease [Betaproteobacteria bacterium]|jgi:TRAP-type C4-dicarboxylate transport system permease small subunit|nr:TRAP transporter small permease [Betaproteobacteria bacterium]
MAETSSSALRPADPVGRVLFDISRVLAVFGGVVLFAMAWLTAVSVTGRAAFSTPIPGDFELVSIGAGVAIFAFLPYCQITRSNVIVDFFMVRAPTRAKTICDAIGALLYLVIGAILTWRLILGGLDMYRYSERTMTINFPRWTTFPVSVLLMMFLVVVVAYTIWRSIAETRANRFFDVD